MPIRIEGMPLGKRTEPLLGPRLETLPLPAEPPMAASPVATPPLDVRAPGPTPNQIKYGDNYDRETDSYRIGRNRAPEHGQIGKGEVRNPRGRPKGSKNRATLLRQALDTKVPVTLNGRSRRISRLELGYRNLSAQVAKGDLRALEVAERLIDKLIGSDSSDTVAEPALSEAELSILGRRYDQRC